MKSAAIIFYFITFIETGFSRILRYALAYRRMNVDSRAP